LRFGAAPGSQGPYADHTKGSALGSYAYLDGSTGSFISDASLKTPALGATAVTCEMSFWYFDPSSNTGSLTVFTYFKLA